MDLNNLESLEVNQFEYCTVAEDTVVPTNSVKVYIPKVNVSTNKNTSRPQKSILINDEECRPIISGSVKFTDTFTVKTFSGLELSKSAINHVYEPCIHNCSCGSTSSCRCGRIIRAMIPKGTQMIVCFMNNNINDGYLTNFL